MYSQLLAPAATFLSSHNKNNATIRTQSTRKTSKSIGQYHGWIASWSPRLAYVKKLYSKFQAEQVAEIARKTQEVEDEIWAHEVVQMAVREVERVSPAPASDPAVDQPPVGPPPALGSEPATVSSPPPGSEKDVEPQPEESLPGSGTMSHSKDINKGESEDANKDKNKDTTMDQNDEHATSSVTEDEHDEHATSSATEHEPGTEQPDEKSGDMSS